MTLKTLRTWNTSAILFSGHFETWKACLEAAIAQSIDLDYVLLEDADIGHANLDNASFNYARFNRCNLAGANLSECSMIKASFTDCIMNNVCLTDTVAVGARFTHSTMANMDVHYADLRGIMVTCPQFLHCDFTNTAHMAGSAFMAHGALCPMTRRPVFLRGLGMDIVMLDEHVIVGSMIVMRRDQLSSGSGLAEAFGRKGLYPNPDIMVTLLNTVDQLAA